MKITISEKLWSGFTATKSESKIITQTAEIGLSWMKFKFKGLVKPIIFKIKRRSANNVEIKINEGLCLCEGNTQNRLLTIKSLETSLPQIELATPTMDAGANYIINIEK